MNGKPFALFQRKYDSRSLVEKGQEHLTPAYKLYESTRVNCSPGLQKNQIEKGNNI